MPYWLNVRTSTYQEKAVVRMLNLPLTASFSRVRNERVGGSADVARRNKTGLKIAFDSDLCCPAQLIPPKGITRAGSAR